MSLKAQPKYELEATCEVCESNESVDCPDCCDEPIKEFNKQGWVFFKDKYGSIYAFCSDECLKEFKKEDDGIIYVLSPSEADFDDDGDIEIVGNPTKKSQEKS